jgi:hypothetical protein
MIHCQLFTQLSYVTGNYRLFEKKKKEAEITTILCDKHMIVVFLIV